MKIRKPRRNQPLKSIKGTKTADNLMKAFAGESQAYIRYKFYAEVAQKEGYKQIYNIFNTTAMNEKAHAKILYDHLVKDYNEGEVVINNTPYPVSLYTDTCSNLHAAASGEEEEWHDLYPAFAKVAQEEGFPGIATSFKLIGSVEQHHYKRFTALKDNIEQGKVFKKDNPDTKWICQHCGYIYTGEEAPVACPNCHYPQGQFELLADNY